MSRDTAMPALGAGIGAAGQPAAAWPPAQTTIDELALSSQT
jgi:hypothetical protein